MVLNVPCSSVISMWLFQAACSWPRRGNVFARDCCYRSLVDWASRFRPARLWPSSFRARTAGRVAAADAGRCRRWPSTTRDLPPYDPPPGYRRAPQVMPQAPPPRTYEPEALPPPGPYGAAPGRLSQGRDPPMPAARRLPRGCYAAARPYCAASPRGPPAATAPAQPSCRRIGSIRCRPPASPPHPARRRARHARPAQRYRRHHVAPAEGRSVPKPDRARNCRRSSGARTVDYRTREPAGTIVIDTAEHVSLSRPRQRQGDALRHRRRPRRLHLGRRRARHPHGRVAGLASAVGDDRAPALSAALHGGRRRQPDGCARALSRQDASTASTAPISRRPSARSCRRAASASPTRTSSTSTTA